MTKSDSDDDDLSALRPLRLAEAKRLEQGARRLSARRQRDLLPVRIETPRLVLRPPIRGDVPDLVRLADNRRIHEVLARLPHPYTRADGIAFVEIFAQRADERPYAITMGDRFIGIVGFTFLPDKDPELGYWLGEPFWGKGLMSEAVKALLAAAFETPDFPRIVARALVSNAGSLNVLRKAGFREAGSGTETDILDRPVLYFELERPKWM